MGKKRNFNHFAAKKREQKLGPKPDKRSEPYQAIVKENELFCKFYKSQNICSNEDEWNQFLTTIKDNLPVTFRLTGYKEASQALLNIIQNDIFAEYMTGFAELHKTEQSDVIPPRPLEWYPNNLAWQLNLTRKDIRSSEHLHRLHNFLISETNAGSISRQEAVSMIPPLILNVQPNDKVLDMCAAPGSKTAQLIEALHAGNDPIPSGYIVANDVDNNRCYMLVHQAKRLNSPCFIVTNHDSSHFPNLYEMDAQLNKQFIKFDKILCDVPCSGDGTLRKNPDIWGKWTPAQANNLNGIAKRGAELLKIGGRLVYSTCSLNPIENEAVIQRLITESNGALEIVEASSLVPGLKFKEGLRKWVVTSKEVEVYEQFENVPEKYHTVIRPHMFPAIDNDKLGLEKCLRILPHLQNTGAFFVTCIEKKANLPWQTSTDSVVTKKEFEKNDESSSSKPKKRRIYGYKEDPFCFFEGTEEAWNEIKSFYNIDCSLLNPKNMLTRCNKEKKKNIYLCSTAIRDFVRNNEENIKIINTGIKVFARCENKNNTICSYRLAQEGLNSINTFMGDNRRVDITSTDLITLLQCTDPTKPPSIQELSTDLQNRFTQLIPGSCILRCQQSMFTLFVVGWRGSSSIRAYVDQNDTVHLLRLLGGDLSKYEINKFLNKGNDTKVDNLSNADTKVEDLPTDETKVGKSSVGQ